MRRKRFLGLLILFLMILVIVVGLVLLRPATGVDTGLSVSKQTEVFGNLYLEIQQTQTYTAQETNQP